MQVHNIAKSAMVSTNTIRYYTRIGLLNPQKCKSNGYLAYDQKDLRRLNFILNARQLGFSIGDIKQVIREAKKGNSPCPIVRELISSRLKETEKRFKEAEALRIRMQDAIDQWQSKPDLVPTGDMICQLIEEFEPSTKSVHRN